MTLEQIEAEIRDISTNLWVHTVDDPETATVTSEAEGMTPERYERSKIVARLTSLADQVEAIRNNPENPEQNHGVAGISFRSTINAHIGYFVGFFRIGGEDPVEDVWEIGFEHDGIHILNPLLSTCSRYCVDPVAEYGLENALGWLRRATAKRERQEAL